MQFVYKYTYFVLLFQYTQFDPEIDRSTSGTGPCQREPLFISKTIWKNHCPNPNFLHKKLPLPYPPAQVSVIGNGLKPLNHNDK